jgi:hypothetical protein
VAVGWTSVSLIDAGISWQHRAVDEMIFRRSVSMGSVVAICSMLIFGSSLFRDAYYAAYAAGRDQPMHALQALLTGWMTVFGGYIAWLANPLLVMSWIQLFKSKYTAAALYSIAAFAAAASFLLQSRIWLDEAGNIGLITARASGYWLWLSSIGIALIGSAYAAFK